MILDKQTLIFSNFRAALSVPVFSMQYIVNWPIRFVTDWRFILSSHNKLVMENRSLIEEQLLLRAEVNRLASIESENQQLRVLLHASAEVRGRVLEARLLAVSTDSFTHQITINRGRSDGLFVGQLVLDAYGVLGQVIRVNPLSSQVLLINDSHSGVPIEVVRSGIRAIAVGDLYSGQLRLTNVPQTADVRVGDLLVTSGMGNNYPQGYPVGKVNRVKRDAGLQFSTIQVEPVAHIDRSWQVLLVWPNRLAGSKETGAFSS